jgi:uncharacterized protein YqhQ
MWKKQPRAVEEAGQAVIKQAVQHMSRILYRFCHSHFLFISFIFAFYYYSNYSKKESIWNLI